MDYVTVKADIMATENSALPSQEYNFFFYIQIEISHLNSNNISQYYSFYCIVNQINAAFVSIIDCFQYTVVYVL